MCPTGGGRDEHLLGAPDLAGECAFRKLPDAQEAWWPLSPLQARTSLLSDYAEGLLDGGLVQAKALLGGLKGLICFVDQGAVEMGLEVV